MVAMAESEEKTALKPNNFAQVHRRGLAGASSDSAPSHLYTIVSRQADNSSSTLDLTSASLRPVLAGTLRRMVRILE